MLLTFRPIKTWPEGWQDRGERPYTPFRAGWSDTLDVLDRELGQLHATSATLQVDATERDCRLDGQLRADAKVRHPGVVLTIETRKLGTLVYATDRYQGFGRFPGWQANLRAVALGLEALRKVERYGIAERGQQYAGYRELGSGTPLGPGPTVKTMTAEEAAIVLGHAASWAEPWTVDRMVADVDVAYRCAAKVHHPDAGGDPDAFRHIAMARNLLANL